MTTAKTRPTEAAVEDYLAARGSESQRSESRALISLLERLTGAPPTMWGPSIVGFGRYRYVYESGRSGEACRLGFALRGKETVLYLAAEAADHAALLQQLGPHRAGKACLYFRQLGDLDLKVLETLLAGSLNALARRYPATR